ncbi:MAG: class I SAM-dependent methyltransferase [Candidatus Acidiferrales bacterium]
MSQLNTQPLGSKEFSETQTSARSQETSAEILPDRELVEQFLRRGLIETSNFHAFWGYFVAALTRDLSNVPNEDPSLTTKMALASYFLAALTKNFYGGTAENFYWQAGKLRQGVFRIAQDYGIHLMPAHFYSPVPEAKALPADFWTRRREAPGVEVNVKKQLTLLATLARRFRKEYEAFPARKPPGSPPHTYYSSNGFFDDIDGYVLYSIVRHFRPRRVIEIGSGNTTYLFAQAIARNREDDRRYRCDLTAIEPYPNGVLKAGFPGLTRLITKPAQQVPISEFEKLAKNDILFIDSSHILKIGSDVQYELLEILPRLSNGVIVHFHDIFLPNEYPQNWVEEMNRYFTEQYLLQAFLAFNDSFEVLLAPPYLHAKHPRAMEAAFQSYHRDQAWTPSSFWIRRVR